MAAREAADDFDLQEDFIARRVLAEIALTPHDRALADKMARMLRTLEIPEEWARLYGFPSGADWRKEG